MAKGTKEIHFEEHIENYLTTLDKYNSIDAKDYDKDLCLLPKVLIKFIKESQPNQYKKLEDQYGSSVDTKIAENVAKNIRRRKTLEVLRNGIMDRGQRINLAFFKPSNNKTPEHQIAYEQNQLSMVRQLKYSKRNNNEIDIVLFINGIPVVSAELKNALTGQNHHNAIKQYIQNRDPKGEPFLEFKRCLVHFAVGTEKVFMTTELKGKSTYFLPFNKDLVNSNPNGFAVSYLWEDVWSKDSIMDLVQNFISLQTDKELSYNEKTKQLEEKKSTKLLFPRFHQRRAVHRILDALKTDGTGENYLIQHSAGSGKSNTITWLAYRLANFYQNYTDTRALFDSVIVVTDRRLLNKQIQENIRQLDQIPGMIAYIDEKASSQDLKKAIEDKKKVIITTIQKFPYISDCVANFPDRNYAILIDEAHSSQSGEVAREMRKTLSIEVSDEEDLDLDELIANQILQKGQQENISQFAFTATPKPKTIELFGTLINGQKTAFDKYTMEQAIKEGFILDVLKNYMSFKRYYKLIKSKGIPDEEYEKKKTIRVLNNYVDLDEHAIETKTKIMLDHFVSQTQNKIQGKARAMLVTRSRLHAVRYKLKFDELMSEMGLKYRALVAFSGTVKDPDTGLEFTEKGMNQLEGRYSIQEALKIPENRILIVANKFQTGFDEPMMQTMFVDKKLGGANTVQTLSRLNRTERGKDSTMVLDFENQPEEIREDFQHFYGRNFIEQDNLTDPNSLYDVLDQINDYGVFYETEVESFAKIYFHKNDDYEKLQPILNTLANRFTNDLDEDQQREFKSVASSYTKLYRFLSQIISFTDVNLEKKYVFLSALLKKLPHVKSNLPFDVVNDVELDSYKIQYKYTSNLELTSGDTEDTGMTPGGLGQAAEDEFDLLTKILKTLNDTFGMELTQDDKVEFEKIKENMYSNDELMSFFNKNNSKDNIKQKFDAYIDDQMLNLINSKLDFYNKVTERKLIHL